MTFTTEKFAGILFIVFIIKSQMKTCVMHDLFSTVNAPNLASQSKAK